MENTSENKKNEWKKQPFVHLTLGILAHVLANRWFQRKDNE